MTVKTYDSQAIPIGWKMTVAEVSAGVYSVVARGPGGRSITRSGTDPDVLLEECRVDIHMLVQLDHPDIERS